MNKYFDEINKNKYFTLVRTKESKYITKNSDNYNEKYMKIEFNLDDELPLNKTIEHYSMIIVVRTAFHEK